MPLPSPILRFSRAGRLLVAVALMAAALITVPGSVEEAGAQTGVCPVGTTLGTTSWGTGTPGGMIWANTAANGISGASQTYTNVAGPVDMTLSYTDPDNVNEDLDNPYLNFVTGDSWDGPVYTRTNGTYGAAFFTIVMNSLTSDQTVDWSFAFNKPVFVPDFTVSDVDWAGYGYNSSGIGMPHESFQDEVILAGQRGGNAIATTATGGSGMTDLGGGQLVAGPYVAGVNGNVGPTDAAGTVSLTTVGPVTSFNMQYSNGPDDATADALDGSPPAPIPPNSPGVSNNHAVAISNFTVCAGNLRFGDLVWADIDGDGLRDATEPGIPGVLVSISDPQGNVVETQTTDANGAYEFEQFPGFTWVVSIDAPAGYTPTYDRDGGTLDSTAINPTTNEFDIDFGLQPDPGSISGSVFTDRTNDGLLDPAQQEVALPGVTVELSGQDLAGNTITASTITAADGSYTFIGVPAGVYEITETQPTVGFADGQDTPGTNAVADGNDQHEVTLGQLESSVGNNFAEVPTSSISGTVFEDADDDGSIDATETGIAGVPITVAGTDVFGNTVSFATTTLADGTYLVPRLVSGTYSVTETTQPAAFADGQESVGSSGGTVGADTFTAIPLGYDDPAIDYNFGELPVSSISGRVADELGGPIPGVTIQLSGTDDLGGPITASTTTAADGTYSFSDLRPGTYTVTETQPAAYGDGLDSVGTIDATTVGTLGNDVISDIVITVGANGVDYDFNETLGSIAGSVVDDGGNSIAGVTVALSGIDANGQTVTASATTAANGTYTFDDLVSGTYTVVETQPAGYGDGGETAGTSGGDDTTNDQISAISLGGGVDATGYDFDETRSSLSGQVFVDPDNDGVFSSGDSPEAGVTLTLTGTDVFGATVSATTTTAVDGTYRFDGLIEGTYQIDESQPAGLVDGIDTLGSAGGSATVNDRFSAISLGAGIGGTDYDFAELPPAGITGSVADSNGDPISGVVLTLTGTSTFGATISEITATAADGSYSFFDLPPGTYTITESQPIGYGDGLDALGTVGGTTVGTLGNDIISDIALGTDSIGVDYDFTETFASIAGTVVDDAGNGIAGVAIELTGTDDLGTAITASTTTAADGTYTFNDLLGGTYTVTETQPTAYGDGGQAAGSSGGDDSTTNDQISAIALAGGIDATGYGFDETRGSLRGRVYEDVNNNGTSQATEPRIGGVTITLTGTDVLGNTVNLTTNTATNGNYRFDDLLAGTYTVTETQPAGYADGIDRAGAAGGDISVNDEISAIALAGGQIASGYLFGEIQPSSVGGTVFIDDNDNGTQDAGDIGIGGVTIDLSGTDDLGATVTASTTTAANGTYTFAGLRPGTYTVTETQPTAYLDGTDSAGSAGGDDTSTNDAISAITLPTNTAATGYDFAELEGASISGAVIDDGGNPIESVVITLAGTDDLGATVTASTTTAANGTYSFAGLRPGTYTVTETQPSAYGDGGQTAGSAGGDDTSVNDQISGIALPAASDVTDYDFDETRGSIAGVVYEDTNNNGVRNGGEAGIAGVSVRLTGVDASGALIDVLTTTIADGSYLFEPLLAGTYTVTETQPTAYLDGIDTAGTAGGTTATDDEIGAIALPGGIDATTNNFGELVASSLGGTVVDDAGTGIAGALISLSGTDDLGATVNATTTTAVDGSYSFSGLRPGSYALAETQPSAYLDGGETAGSVGGDASVDDVISAVTLPSATSASSYDFDEIRASSIGGTVVDDDGTGINGVAMTLSGTDDLGALVSRSATTAVDGTYGFVGLRPGTYTVTETQPATHGDGGQTAGSAGGDDTSVNDQISGIALPANTSATGYDFDETRGSITGLVFEDTNNNGARDAGEAAISGTTVELNGTDVLGGAVSLTGTTLSNGIVRFNDLLAGDYELVETQPAGYLDGIDTAGTAGGDTSANDTITTIAISGGVNATNYRFGELVASSINGTVFDDDNGDGTQQAGEVGIGSVTVDLAGIDDLGATVTGSTTTAADGAYTFAGLRPGTYAVTETQPTAYLDGIDTAGTAGGDASINDLVSAIVLSSDTSAAGYDFAEIEASSIAGTVVDDAGSGIAGVAIALTGTDDLGATVNTSTTTAADGTYSFSGLRPGTYTVTETQPTAYGDGGETAGTIAGVTVGDDTTNDQVSAIALGAEQDATGYDFDETRGSIAGTVYEDLDGNGSQNGIEPGISGVIVEVNGTDVLGSAVNLSTTTAADGTYAFDDLLTGTYTIAETQPIAYGDAQETIGSAGGTNSTNDEIDLNLAGGVTATGYDFGEVQAASIAGTVVDDAGSGISGVAITLTGSDDLGSAVGLSTATAADGSYSFTGLRPGMYAIAETQPLAYGDGNQSAGTAGGDDTTTNDQISAIALDSGEDATGYDFDETRGSITGLVFEDTNNNGTRDAGEAAISGTTIDLTGTDVLGAAVTASMTTAADGIYSFGDLLTGTYTITETQPTGYLDGIDTAGTAGGTVGSDETASISLAGGTNATGYTFGELLASSISGTVVDDLGTGIAAVTITLTGTDDLGATVSASTATAADGTYTFDGLRPGTYTITETQPTAYLDGGETAGTAGGTVTDDAISAITLPTNTDANGYHFDELLASSMAGTVVDDAGAGIGNVEITLTGTDDLGAAVSLSTTTIADGTYNFDGLRPGTYTVAETQPSAYGDGGETAGTIAGVTVGDDTVDDVVSAIGLPARTTATGYDFDETRGSITGTVYEDLNGNGAQDGAEPGISGVTVELTGIDVLGNTVSLSTTSATSGAYAFADLLAGTYTVAETQPAGYADGQETIGSAGGTNSANDQVDLALAGGVNAIGYDFGEVQAASIAGTVVDDGGNPIVNVTLTLSGTDDLGATVNLSTTTVADGTYAFGSLRPGTYTITETQPAAYGDGGETAGTAGGNDTTDDVISAIALASGEDAAGYDFDETRGSIAGVVFEDTSNNGTQDGAEPGIAGTTVELAGTDVLGNTISLTTTSATNGSYTFGDLLTGDYTVSETQPAGYLDGIDTAGTSAGTLGNDNVSAIALSGGTNATDYAFGEILPSSIAGSVVDDAGTGINAATITLTGTDDLGATVSASTATATDGTYSFANLRPGTYTITETQPAGYLDGGETAGSLGGAIADDAISAITLPTNTDATGYDFDEIVASSIAGTVIDDGGNPIESVTITLTGTDDLGATVTANTTTAANGTYTFANLRPGTYTITETQPPAYGDGGETAGTIAGVTVGNDTVDDVISAITLPVRTDAIGYDFDETRGSIAGTVYEDLDGNGVQNGVEPGISGVTIELTGTDNLGNTVTASASTAANGTYTFGDLLAGTYTATEAQPAGYADAQETIGSAGGTNVVNDEIAAIALAGGDDATSYDFGEVQAASISGTVVDDGGNPIESVTITLTGTDDLGATVNLSTTTAADGTYTFTNLRPGTYTITETQPPAYGDGGETAGTIAGVTVGNDTSDDVISAIGLVSGADAAGYDFDERRGSVAGVVFEDTNNNGTQDAGEPGIGGTLVRLTGVDANAAVINLAFTTTATGDYAFGDLLAGSYRIVENQPALFADGIDTVGDAGGTLANDLITSINLPGGANATGYTFGEIQLSSIAGSVVDDAGTGINTVTITLTGTDDLGATVTASTTTAADGTYTFTNLRPGTYTTTETQPAGYLDGGETAGSLGGAIADDAISAITLPTNTDTTGYDFDEIRASSIAGTVVDDAGTGINTVTITLTGTDDLGATVTANTTTAADGTYTFTNLRPGTYTITETQPPAYGDGGETAGTIAGVTVGTTTNDQIAAVTLAANADAIGYDFDETRGSISGVVFEDTNNNGTQDSGEPAINGVTVDLTGTDVLGAAVASNTTTASDGSYDFGDLLTGDYTVTETQPAGHLDGIDSAGAGGGTVANDNISAIALSGGTDATGYTFGEILASSIAGSVVDDAGTGINGVTITLTGTDDLGATVSLTETTAANGTYTFADLRPGTYTVTETQPAGFLDGGETAGTNGGTVADDAISAITLPTNTDTTGYDFDEIRASSIAGTVVDDAGTGISGVTITLTGTDDLGATVSQTTTTIADGTYSFTNLRPGTYTITETQPAAYGDGDETAGTIAGVTVGVVSNDQIAAVTLAANAAATGYDFDETRGSIAGTVYEDIDGSGVHNGTEPGISGVTVELTGTDVLGGTINLSTTTATNGSYTFSGLLAGTYTVTETQPAGYLDAREAIGSAGGASAVNDQIDLTLPGGTNAVGYDFGEAQAASIAGTVFIDSDNSGSQNGTEVGVDAVAMMLTGTDDLGTTVTANTTTAADGTYTFAGLRPGTYTITETQPTGLSDGLDRVGSAGGTLGNDVLSAIAVDSAEDATGYDFGELEGASLGGTVVDDDGTGIPATTITLSGTDDLGATVTANTTTAANGTYTFAGLRPGTYTITETQPTGYGDGGETAGVIGGVTVGVVADDTIAAITLGSGQSGTGYDFDEIRASISGSVYLDADGNGVRNAAEAGLAGVPVELAGTDDLGATVTRSTTTAADGRFTFDNLISGTYAITETTQPTGLVDGLEAAGTSGGVAGNTVATNDTITGIVLAAGADATDYVFGEWDTSTIGGAVFDELGNPIPGVTLTLAGTEDDGGSVTLTATTGPSGVYTFTGLEPGTYTVTEAQPAAYGDGGENVGTVDGTTTGTATNDRITGIVIGPNSNGVDYDFIETLGSISGTVFDDTNGNGTFNSEPGIDNVTLTLTGTDAYGAAVNVTTTTSTDGSYSFGNVVGGLYTMTQTQPPGYLDGAESIGSAGGSSTTNDVIDGIATAGGADETGYDFGEIDAASISGSVVDDAGNPIVNATITLAGTDDLGATVNLTDVTDVTGVYSFDGLRPGTYTVVETQPVGYGDGGETAGPTGGTVTDDQIAGIVLGPDADASGNDFDELRSTVSGRVFEDLDSSGTADAGEPGINGASINLTGTDVLGSAVDRTIATTGDGDFAFNGLIEGTYTITESQPTAFADGDDTVGTAGGNGTLQNDVVSSIAIGAGVVESGYLFGEVAPVSVTGTVFTDTDNDGSSTGESGIGGVTVSLSGIDDRGQLVNDSTTTASDGSYSFTNLRPGVYTVTETQPGAFLDGIDTVGTVDGVTTGTRGIDQITGIGMTSGQAGSGYDFGELSPSSISGSVVDDLARPIAGVTIVLTGTDDLGGPIALSTVTATDGSYTFIGLRPGTYAVAETQPSAYGDAGQSAGTIDGTTIGVVADDEISAIVLGANSNGIDYNFDEATASISGQVFTDNDGDTVPSTGDTDLVGAAIQLAGSDVNGQAVAASTATAVDGTYRFDGLLAGTYTITETQPAGLLDAIDTAGSSGGSADNSVGGDEISGVSLTAGSSSIGNNFSEVASGSISGSVADDSSNGIVGVTITLTGTDLFGQTVNESTTTGPAGAYTFTGLTPGTYVITETQPVAYGDGGESVGTIDGSTTGVATDDAINAITLLSGQNGVGYDFDETRMSISGTVVIDVDNNGVANIGEAPIPGVSIELTGTDVFGATVTATTATAADGTYRFDGLLAGTYTITETQPAGFVDGAETAGSAGGTVDPAADSVSGITVIAGANATGYDFGELEPASLAGSVIDDLGRPIAGVGITVTGTDDRGNAITATATTVADGTYTFDGLRPGTYTIIETQPAAYGDGGQTAGTIGGTTTGVVADDQVTTIVLGSGDVGIGYDFDETTGSLTGSVLHATGAGDAPISGVAIELSGTDANGDAVAASTTTVVDGTYAFGGLLAGDYTITETQPIAFADGPERIGTAGGDATTNDVITTIALSAGTDASGYEFTETGTVLSGRVRIDRTGDGVPDPTDDLDLSGIIIDLLGSDGSVIATTTTAADGTYVMGGLLAGDYTVRQTQPPEWGSISPNDRPINLPVTGLSNIDFDEEAASISGTVFVDADANGLDDQNTPQSGVTVTLADGTGVIATTTSDAGGNYTFIGLPAADYTVTVVAPSDSTFTIRDAGTDDSIDSDIDPTTGMVGVSLPAGADLTDVDAGIVEIERDLAIAINTRATEVKVGDEVTFTTTVTNSGNTLIDGGVTVTIPVPTNTTFVSANGTGWTITVTDGVITATRPDPLAPGEVTPPITLVVEPTQVGTISVTGQVVSSSGLVETTTANNVSSVPITVTATTTSIPNLAYTGSSLLLLLLIAGGLIASGRTLMLIGGPRRKDDD